MHLSPPQRRRRFSVPTRQWFRRLGTRTHRIDDVPGTTAAIPEFMMRRLRWLVWSCVGFWTAGGLLAIANLV